MHKLLCLSWLCAVFPLGAFGADELSTDGRAALERLIDSAIANHQITAAVATVEIDGTSAWRYVAGEMEPGVPMRADPILPLASVGKMFTATAAMILYEQGVIRLEDPVSKYIPEFSSAKVALERDGVIRVQPAVRPITVYQLLTHTAGFVVDGDAFWKVWDAHIGKTTTTHFARDLLALNLQSQPGERFDYGQTGAAYEVLGAVIEIASGKTLEAYMQEVIFQPLNLEDSYFYVPDEKSARLPAVYRRVDGELVVDRRAGDDFSRSTYFNGGGGVRSAPADVLRFARVFLNGGQSEGIRLLKPETVDMMMRDQLGGLAPERWKAAQLSWGFGASVSYVEHDSKSGVPDQFGWVGGGFAKLWVDPRRRMIAYINFPLTPPGDNQLLRDFEKRVYSAVK